MRFAFKLGLLVVVLAALGGGLGVHSAHASPVFTLTLTESDATTGSHTVSATGAGGVVTLTNVGLGELLISNLAGTVSTMDLNSLEVSTTSGMGPFTTATLTITMTANDLFLVTNSSPFTTTLTQIDGGTLAKGATLTTRTNVDTTNSMLLTGPSVTQSFDNSAGALGSPIGIWSGTGSTPVTLTGTPLSDPFSMTVTETIVFTGSGESISGNVQNTLPDSNGNQFFQAPEPASLALWGLGLAGAGIVGARRRKTAAAA